MSHPDHDSRTASADSAQRSIAPRRRRGLWWWTWRAAFVSLILLLAGGGILWWQLRATPAYVSEYQAFVRSQSPDALSAMAKRVGNRTVAQLTDAKIVDGRVYESPDDVREIRLTLDEMRAWMAVELMPWLEHENVELPPQVNEPGIAIIDQNMVLFATLNIDGFKQNLSVYLSGEVTEDGPATIKIDSIRTGNVPVPAATLTNLIDDPIINDAFNGIEFDPVFSLPDDARRWRPIDLRIEPDAVILKVKVIPSRAAQGRRSR